MSFVRTVLGDILPEHMGLTYSHEHIVIEESYPTVANKDFILNDTDKISAELKEFFKNGSKNIRGKRIWHGHEICRSRKLA